MKYVLGLVWVIVTVFSANSQTVMTKMANGTCECLKKNKVAEKGKDNLELELGLCMIEQVGTNKEALKKAGFNVDAPNFYETLGEKLGMELALTCPYFMNIVSDMLKDENSGLRDKVQDRMSEQYGFTPPPPELPSSKGIVQSVEYGDYVKIILKDSEGKRKEFYWITSFEGDDAIILLSSPDLLVGKTVIVDYVPEELYFYKVKSYFEINKIAALVIQP